MNVQNTIQKSPTLLIVISQTNTRLSVGNFRMNEIETRIKENLSESEVGAQSGKREGQATGRSLR